MRQAHLAAAANLPAVTLCRILGGARPLHFRHVQALAWALGVTPQWLLDGSNGQFFQVLSYPLTDGEVPAPGPDYFRYLTPVTASDPIAAARLGVESSGAVDDGELQRHGFFVHNMASGLLTQVNGKDLVTP